MAGTRLLDPRDARRYLHIVFSAHLDDAALSLGATIARWAERRQRVLLWTLCAGLPPKARRRGGSVGRIFGRDGRARAAARREEDLAASAILGADVFWDRGLDYLDRHSTGSTGELFGEPAPTDPLLAQALASVAAVTAAAPAARLYFPLGIGAHKDHVLLHRASRTLEVDAYYYEDFPYAARPGALAEWFLRHGEFRRFQSVAVTPLLHTKLASVAAYDSQVPLLFGSYGKMARALSAWRSERLWLTGRGPPRALWPPR